MHCSDQHPSPDRSFATEPVVGVNKKKSVNRFGNKASWAQFFLTTSTCRAARSFGPIDGILRCTPYIRYYYYLGSEPDLLVKSAERT